MTPEQIAAFITQLIMMIKQCKDAGAGDDEVANAIRNPRGRYTLKYQLAAKRASGLRGREWRKQKDAIMTQLDAERVKLDDEDIKYLIDEATEE